MSNINFIIDNEFKIISTITWCASVKVVDIELLLL